MNNEEEVVVVVVVEEEEEEEEKSQLTNELFWVPRRYVSLTHDCRWFKAFLNSYVMCNEQERSVTTREWTWHWSHKKLANNTLSSQTVTWSTASSSDVPRVAITSFKTWLRLAKRRTRLGCQFQLDVCSLGGFPATSSRVTSLSYSKFVVTHSAARGNTLAMPSFFCCSIAIFHRWRKERVKQRTKT